MSSWDLSGLTGGYSDILSTRVQDVATDKLKSVASADYSKSTDDELMEVCKQFESYFLEQVFKEMNKTIPTNESADKPTSNLVDYFKDNAISELATQSTERNSLGLAQKLYEQMKRNYDI